MASLSQSTRIHSEDRGKGPLDHGAAMREENQLEKNMKEPRSGAYMPMPKDANAMNDIQSRSMQTKSDSRDRGSLASIARPRKLSILPRRLQ
eukprot:619679-Pleurochrysis_carterae.AAC.1